MTYLNVSSMLNKPLEAVEVEDGSTIHFRFQDGSKRSFDADADCCSRTWIEHLELPQDVRGAVILSVEDSDEAPSQDHPEHDEENGGDCIRVYNTVFKTDRGDIVVEYRNSSNGYYGGSLVDVP